MPEKWTGDLVGRMHNAQVKRVDIAKEMGVSKAYVTMLLNGQKKSPTAEKRLNDAFKAVLEERAQKEE